MRRRIRLLWLPLLASALAGAAPTPLLLDVWIDGRDSGRVLRVTRDANHLTATTADLAGLGLSLSMPGEVIDLAHQPGVAATLDEAGQRLLLSVPVSALPRQSFDLSGAAPAPAAQSQTGAMLRYDLSATVDDVRHPGATSLGGGNLEFDLFTPEALITSSGFVTASRSAVETVRLDSAVQFDHPENLTHAVIGDAVTGAPDWGRAVRFGGIAYASDFSLDPAFLTQPLPSFFGQSAVPTTVQVFSGAAKVLEQDVAPGPFALTNLPVVTGGGAATVVTTDVLGRQTSQSISLYADAGLLAPGLDSFALDAGFLRQAYGLRNFDYGLPLLSGDWRGGISDRLTVSAHGEASRHLVLLGGGGEIGFGFGTLSAGLAASTSRAGNGAQAFVSAHALLAPVNLYASLQAATQDYRDLASLDSAALFTPLPPRLRYQAGITSGLGGFGTLGLSLIGERDAGQGTHAFFSASWSRGLPGGLFLALTALQDFHSHAASAQLSLSIPLDGALATLTGQSDQGAGSGFATYDKPADPDGGFGYRLQGGWQDGGQFQADAADIGDHVAVNGGAAFADQRAGLRAGLDGALVLLRGSLFATHDPGGAVALVQTGDPDIRIYRENRTVAVSDADGEALLTGLEAWSPNRLAIEPRDFSFDALVEKTDASIVPRGHGGVVVDFRPVSRHPLLAMIVRGVPLAAPIGARVILDGEDVPLTLGRDGELFIPDLAHPTGASIDWGGRRCRVWLSPGNRKMPRTAPLLCLREAAGAY